MLSITTRHHVRVCTNPDMSILRSPPGGVVVGKEFYKLPPVVLSVHVLYVIQIEDIHGKEIVQWLVVTTEPAPQILSGTIL